MEEKKRLVIIDANSIIHRAYHALPPLTTRGGDLVNAVYGFLLVFLKVIREFRPDYIAACFDFPGPTIRHKKFKEYKAKRPPAPEELYQQIPKVKEVLKGFGVSIFEKEGFEADDIIATISNSAPKKQVLPKIETTILSGDLDALQLINSQTGVYALRKGVKDTVLYDRSFVKEKYGGLNPEQLLDFKALRGDPSDNIPGVTGIGEKTAIRLLLEFGNLENLYQEIEENSQTAKRIKPKLKEALIKYKEQAFISKDLVRLYKNVPVEFNLEKCRWGNYDKERAARVLKNFDFYSLISRLSEIGKQEKNKLMGDNLKLW